MNIHRLSKPSFSVIGIEGSSGDGPDFIRRLWAEANSRFAEISDLARRNPDGTLSGIWGAMTDFSRAFRPWTENFSKGLYLAGVECITSAEPPAGWSKWTLPSFEYLCTEVCGENTFSDMLEYLSGCGLDLAGAVQDYTDPSDGRSYMLFPIRRLP